MIENLSNNLGGESSSERLIFQDNYWNLFNSIYTYRPARLVILLKILGWLRPRRIKERKDSLRTNPKNKGSKINFPIYT